MQHQSFSATFSFDSTTIMKLSRPRSRPPCLPCIHDTIFQDFSACTKPQIPLPFALFLDPPLLPKHTLAKRQTEIII